MSPLVEHGSGASAVAAGTLVPPFVECVKGAPAALPTAAGAGVAGSKPSRAAGDPLVAWLEAAAGNGVAGLLPDAVATGGAPLGCGLPLAAATGLCAAAGDIASDWQAVAGGSGVSGLAFAGSTAAAGAVLAAGLRRCAGLRACGEAALVGLMTGSCTSPLVSKGVETPAGAPAVGCGS